MSNISKPIVEDLESRYRFLNEEIAKQEKVIENNNQSGQEVVDAFNARVLELTSEIDKLTSSKEGLQKELDELGGQRNLLQAEIVQMKEIEKNLTENLKQTNEILKESKSNIEKREGLLIIGEKKNKDTAIYLEETNKKQVEREKGINALLDKTNQAQLKFSAKETGLNDRIAEVEQVKLRNDEFVEKLKNQEKVLLEQSKDLEKSEKVLKDKLNELNSREQSLKQDSDSQTKISYILDERERQIIQIEKQWEMRNKELEKREKEFIMKDDELKVKERILKTKEKAINLA